MPIHFSSRRFRVLGIALTGALCVFAGSASAASAGPADQVVATTPSGINILETPETRQTCAAPQLVSAFAGVGDTRDYVLAPGGSFESKSLAGWQVQKAKVEGGGSPLELHGNDDNKQHLKIPQGGSATSPAMCVDLNYPTMRLMAKAQKNKGQLKIEVVYPDSDNPVFHPVGSLTAGESDKWQTSDDMPVFPERGGASAGMRRVALRFTSIAAGDETGDWRIDDLYVDPNRR